MKRRRGCTRGWKGGGEGRGGGGEEKEMGISSTFPPRSYPSSFYIEMILSDRKEERQEENFCRRERGNNGEG